MIVKNTRYSQYRDSGIESIGETPADWKLKRLKYVCTVNPNKSELHVSDDIDVTFIPMENILSVGKLDTSIVKVLSEVSSGYTYFREEDIIIAKVTPCFENGNIAVAEGLNNGIGFGTTELHVLRANKESINRFIFYLIQSNRFKLEGIASMYGVAGLKRIPVDFVSNFIFALPSIAEQTQIANFLDQKTAEIDSLITDKEKLITLLEEQRQAIITEAVTKGLNPDVKMKDSNVEWIGEVPQEWQICEFRRVSKLQQGLQIAQEERFTEGGPGRLEYITIKYLNSQRTLLDQEFIENPSKRVVCYPEDVLLARTGATGVVVTNVFGVFHNNFFKVDFNKSKLHRDYLVYYLKQDKIQEHFKLVAGTTTIPDLNHGEFLSTICLIPSMDEQIKIVEFLNRYNEHFETIITEIKNQVNKVKEYRQSLIFEAVTGKIDVRNVVLEPTATA